MSSRTRHAFISLAVLLLGGTQLGLAAPAFGTAITYEFDPVLSLVGNCTTSKDDLVEDPGCPGGQHPPKPFAAPKSIAVDPHGDVFIASYGKETANGTEGRIDIFDPNGFFLSEIPDPGGPESLAVDSKGILYVFEHSAGVANQVSRYEPVVYEPALGEIEYAAGDVIIGDSEGLAPNAGVAVDRSNDHLFVDFYSRIAEYGSATEKNSLLNGEIGKGVLQNSTWIAVDSAHRKLYASASEPSLIHSRVQVFDLDPPYSLLNTLDGSNTPEGEFLSTSGLLSIGVEEATGNFFIDDRDGGNRVYEFTEGGSYLATIEHSFQYVFPSQIAVDNGPSSPNRGYLYVPSNPGTPAHSFAFGPLTEGPPEIDFLSFSGVTPSEAFVRAGINPDGLETDYVLQYTSEQQYLSDGWVGATTLGEGEIPAGTETVDVSASLNNLEADTDYRFRVVVENKKGNSEREVPFTTFPEPTRGPSCPNDALRVGRSQGLPDCRAYELVTPADTNGRTPRGIGFFGDLFRTSEASPDGENVSFHVEGGALPGYGGTGAFNGDPYLATRRADGWHSEGVGPSGSESMAPGAGSSSPDQKYSFWATGKEEEGSAVIDNKATHYVRYPDGHSALLGRGEKAIDPHAEGVLITNNGEHILFQTLGGESIQIEEDAPPDGTAAIYDRTPDEVTHVVSLLPGNETPEAGENAEYVGASADGEGIAFRIGKKLYLRVGDAETFEIGEGVTFADVSEGGKRIFYVEGGDLFAFDTETEEDIAFTEVGNAVPVNIAAGGTRAYFVSTTAIPGSGENPNGSTAQPGQQNLYLSGEGDVGFVGVLTERDVKGDSEGLDALGAWVANVGRGTISRDPSRSTPDGRVLLFESRADLSGYDPEGHAEIYRYDEGTNTLSCIACNPTKAPASTDASLQSYARQQDRPGPFSAYGYVPNLRQDGRRAFFQTEEGLVVTDTNHLQDVYEWEDEGVGTCASPGGCVYLVSGGHSAQSSYLYGVSATGDDVFFLSSDLLVPADTDAIPSIYDARVDGGFPVAQKVPCQAESCRGQAVPPPSLTPPASPLLGASGNITEVHCRKGSHKIKRHRLVRCVKNHERGKKHHHSQKKGGK